MVDTRYKIERKHLIHRAIHECIAANTQQSIPKANIIITIFDQSINYLILYSININFAKSNSQFFRIMH